MQHSSSSEATMSSASQKIPPYFVQPEGSLPHSQVPATYPCPEPIDPVHTPYITLPEDPS